MPAHEHCHKSARVEAHEYIVKGDEDKGIRIPHELRRVSGTILVIFLGRLRTVTREIIALILQKR